MAFKLAFILSYFVKRDINWVVEFLLQNISWWEHVACTGNEYACNVPEGVTIVQCRWWTEITYCNVRKSQNLTALLCKRPPKCVLLQKIWKASGSWTLAQHLIYVLMRMVRRIFGGFFCEVPFKIGCFASSYVKLGLEKLGCERVWGTFV